MRNIERIIIKRLIAEQAKAGYVPVQYFDGMGSDGEYVPLELNDEKILEVIDTVDAGTLHFAPAAKHEDWGRRGVLLILGNGEDVISDWHTSDEAFGQACERTLDAIEEKQL